MWVPKPSHGWPLASTIRLTRHGQGSDTLFNHNGLLASSSTHSGGGIPNSISVKFVAVPGWPLFHATSLDGLCWQGVVAAGGVVWCGVVGGSGSGVVGSDGVVVAGVMAWPHQ